MPDIEPPKGDANHSCVYPELVARVSPVVGVPETIINDWYADAAGRRLEVIGDAVARVRPCFEALFGDSVHLTPEMPDLAPLLAKIGAARVGLGGVPPHALRPVYIRRPDVELARERRFRRTEKHPAE